MQHSFKQAALPFSGLGFDLAPVLARVSLLRFTRVRFSGVRTHQSMRGMYRRPAGYALLVELSREIRGR